MSSRLTKIIADFQTSLSTLLTVGATTGNLLSAKDDDGVALPSGNYFLTIDPEYTSIKEHLLVTITGNALSAIKSVSRQGVQTTGCARVHRVGATVILTDWAILKELTNLLDGTVALNAATPLIYDADPAITDSKHLSTKKYIDDVATAGALKATIAVLGISKMSYAPVDSANPIAVVDNDPRVPTQGENDALAGSSGTPGSGNKYVTETDPNFTVLVKLTGNRSEEHTSEL